MKAWVIRTTSYSVWMATSAWVMMAVFHLWGEEAVRERWASLVFWSPSNVPCSLTWEDCITIPLKTYRVAEKSNKYICMDTVKHCISFPPTGNKSKVWKTILTVFFKRKLRKMLTKSFAEPVLDVWLAGTGIPLTHPRPRPRPRSLLHALLLSPKCCVFITILVAAGLLQVRSRKHS